MNSIGFNKPFLTGKEMNNIMEAVSKRHLSGNGYFTRLCHDYFINRYGFNKCLLTTSCTDALEMSALLLDIKPGDEVIIPSYTFVSTANAFILRGAKIVFADSCFDHPNIDVSLIESLITPKTKAIVIVHYGGVACNMEVVLKLSKLYNLYVVEDAAQAIDSYYKDQPLGSLGHLATFSFHETKNIIAGEGGMLVINDKKFENRSDIIWEKGTNRKAFFNGEIDKYGWVDVGSSFLPSEIIAAFLHAQLENLEIIQSKRKSIWEYYYKGLKELEGKKKIKLPVIPEYASNNAHLFYLICDSETTRKNLIEHLRLSSINAVFHYLSLHNSIFYKNNHDGRALPMSDYFSERLLRLPFYYELTREDQDKVISSIMAFFK